MHDVSILELVATLSLRHQEAFISPEKYHQVLEHIKDKR